MKKKNLLFSTIALLMLASCAKKNDTNFDEKLYLPEEKISINDKKLGYVYPTAGWGKNTSFKIEYNENSNYPVLKEHFSYVDYPYEVNNITDNMPLTYDITIYPSDLSNISLKIKPVYKEGASLEKIGKSGSFNIYNNDKVFATLEYNTSYEMDYSYNSIENYIKDNFVVINDYNYKDLFKNDNVVNNIHNSYNVESANYLTNGIEKYKVLLVFKDKDELFFNNLYIKGEKCYYINELGKDLNNNYSFKVNYSLSDINTLNLSILKFKKVSYENNVLSLDIYYNTLKVGELSFTSTIDLSDYYENFINNYLNK